MSFLGNICFSLKKKFRIKETNPTTNPLKHKNCKNSRRIERCSAERETDVNAMRERFETISKGGYKKKLYDLFGETRTEAELKEVFEFKFFP